MKAEPPYYAVIFTSERTALEAVPYEEMAREMMALAKGQPGFLGVDHAREEVGITVSYWDSLENIARWKSEGRHRFAQTKGREVWYASYTIRICRVERAYSFHRVGQESGEA